MGAEITYAYEDLLFIEHNHFLLQFGDVGSNIYLYHNIDSKEEESASLCDCITRLSSQKGIEVIPGGKYSLKDNEDGTIAIEFYDPAV